MNREEMIGYLWTIVTSLQNYHLRSLIEFFLTDIDWLKAFSEAPAAKRNHQAYLGGLLEHTYNMLRLAPALAKVYPEIDAELLTAGIILHDIGKVKEYSWERFIDFTGDGRFLGHIILGVELLSRAMDLLPAFPQKLRLKLMHMIVSHHGRYEWQSPKRPKFLEAYLLHQIDLLDAEADKFRKANNTTGGDWAWSKSLGRYLYLGEEEAESE